MMSKKPLYMLASVFLLASMILAACSAPTSVPQTGGNQPAATTAATESTTGNVPSTGKVTVTVMTWENTDTNAAIDEALKSFMASNPDIAIQRIPTPNSNYGDKLNSMVQNKSLPDIFWAGNDTAFLYGDQGLLYDWSAKAKAETSTAFNLSQFAPGSIENWTSPSGKLYGLPTLMNTYGFWYNEDLFTKANVPLPKPGWTWDDMFKAAKALTVKNGNAVTRYGIYNPPDDPFMTSLCGVSNGGQSFMNHIIQPTQLNIDSQYIDCAKRWADAVQAGYVTPPGYPTDGITDQFIAGQVPMLWFGQWLAPTFITAKPSFKYGFAPMPIGSKDVQPYDAVGICSPATIKNPDAVWKVMKFLASDAWKTVLPKAPVAPAAHLPSSQPYFDALKADGLASVADSVQYELNAKDKQGIRFTATWSAKANDILTADWNDILSGKKNLINTITSMVNDLTSVISSTK